MRCVQAIVALMATGAILLAGAGRSGATVICEGVDGHVEIEAASQGVCASDVEWSSGENAAAEAVYTVQHRGDHCGPCVDIPLVIGAGTVSSVMGQAKRTEIKVLAVSVFLEMNTQGAAPVSPFAQGSDGFLISPMPVYLRTVTLLI